MNSNRINLPELFKNFGETLPPEEFDKKIIAFLTKKSGSSEAASVYIRQTLTTTSSGQLNLSFFTRILNQLGSDIINLDDFSRTCVEFTEKNNFAEFVYIQTFKIVNSFLNEDGTLKFEIIKAFADASGLTENLVLEKLYGNEKDSILYKKKVKLVADKIVEGCTTGLWSLFSDALNAGSKNISPDTKKLADSKACMALLSPGIDIFGNAKPEIQSWKKVLDDLTSLNKLREYLYPSQAAKTFCTHLITNIGNLSDISEKLTKENEGYPATHIKETINRLSDIATNYSDIAVSQITKEKSDIPCNMVNSQKRIVDSIIKANLKEIENDIGKLELELVDEQKKSEEKEKIILQKFFKIVSGNKPAEKVEITALRKQLSILYQEQAALENIRAGILEIASSHTQVIINSFEIRIDIYQKLAAGLGKNDKEVNETTNEMIPKLDNIKNLAIINPENFRDSCQELHKILNGKFNALLQTEFQDELKKHDEVVTKFLAETMKPNSQTQLALKLDDFRIAMKNFQENIVRNHQNRFSP